MRRWCVPGPLFGPGDKAVGLGARVVYGPSQTPGTVGYNTHLCVVVIPVQSMHFASIQT